MKKSLVVLIMVFSAFFALTTMSYADTSILESADLLEGSNVLEGSTVLEDGSVLTYVIVEEELETVNLKNQMLRSGLVPEDPIHIRRSQSGYFNVSNGGGSYALFVAFEYDGVNVYVTDLSTSSSTYSPSTIKEYSMSGRVSPTKVYGKGVFELYTSGIYQMDTSFIIYCDVNGNVSW